MFDFNLPEADTSDWLDQEGWSEKLDCPRDCKKDDTRELLNYSAPNAEKIADEAITINEQRFGPMIGKSRSLRKAFEQMAKTAASNASVIIYGESGTGKELAAQTIHNLSPRRHNRLVPVNCGAIPEELIESEFFGYKKGAFTGAGVNKPGYLDWADRGTLFLDEVGELSHPMQVKLLRALDGNGYAPIGSQEIKLPDIRIIAATNRDLKENVRNGLMREDFYYRINVLPIRLPPLRERKDDLPLLIDYFLACFYRGQASPTLPPAVIALLEAYDWPGNIRELQNTIQRYVALKEIGFLKPSPNKAEAAPGTLSEFCVSRDLKSALEEFEKQYITQCLKATSWHQGKACAVLKINRKTLYKKMQRYKLEKTYDN
jgi:transcriptional regulator with PAS, ATPase and Fis domain